MLQQFDREGSGYVDARQLKHVLMHLGEKMDEAEVDALIQEAGPDSDGQLNYTSTFLYLINTVRFKLPPKGSTKNGL